VARPCLHGIFIYLFYYYYYYYLLLLLLLQLLGVGSLVSFPTLNKLCYKQMNEIFCSFLLGG
jgi:hypothetical protein